MSTNRPGMVVVLKTQDSNWLWSRELGEVHMYPGGRGGKRAGIKVKLFENTRASARKAAARSEMERGPEALSIELRQLDAFHGWDVDPDEVTSDPDTG